MVFPLIAASLIGAAGSIGGGILGANAADSAAEQNWKVALLNYFQRERERSDAMREASINRRDTKLGQTDAKGNRTYFKEGVGWVTDMDPQQQLLMMMQDEEIKKALADKNIEHAAVARQGKMQFKEEDLADTFLRQMKNVRKQDDSGIAADLFNKQMVGVNDASSNALNRALRTGLRMDSTNLDRIVEGSQKALGETTRNAKLDSVLKTRGLGQQEANAERAGLANLYNMFATRAVAKPGVTYQPQNLTTGSNAALAAGAQGLQSASQSAQTAAGKAGGELPYIQPNYGLANAIGGGATALASALKIPNNGITGFGAASANPSKSYVQNEEPSVTQIW